MKHSKHNDKDIEWYLNSPNTRKWIVQCITCGTYGFRADAPEEFFGRVPLEKHFGQLNLNEIGICDDCSRVI